MTRAEAVKRLQRIYGAVAGYRVDTGAGTEYEREAARAEAKIVKAEREAVSKAMEERRRAILAADVEYTELHAKYTELRAKHDRLTSIAVHWKFTAGFTAHGFFHIDAHGDTWEQVFSTLKEKYPSGKR